MTEIAIAQKNDVSFSIEQVDVIKKSIAPEGTTDAELSLFITQCKRTQLDPFSRQIYATKIKGKLSVQATIDGFRLIAERSGAYQGQTLPEFLTKEGKWVEVWTSIGYPIACKVGVLKKGFTQPLYAIAKWDSYAQKTYDGKIAYMWAKMPEVMLAKVAEALALRKAFPNDLSGIYSQEEMDQATQDTAPRHIENEREVPDIAHATIDDLKNHYPKVFVMINALKDQSSALNVLAFSARLQNSTLYSQEEKNRVYTELRSKILEVTNEEVYQSLFTEDTFTSLPMVGITKELFESLEKIYEKPRVTTTENVGDTAETGEAV